MVEWSKEGVNSEDAILGQELWQAQDHETCGHWVRAMYEYLVSDRNP